MYEFFSVVNATYDDATRFPTLSTEGARLPSAWEGADESHRPVAEEFTKVGWRGWGGGGLTHPHAADLGPAAFAVTEARTAFHLARQLTANL